MSDGSDWRTLRREGLLLSSAAMAEFVARGLLRFDAVVPAELNSDFLAAIVDGRVATGGGYAGEPLEGRFPADHPIARLLAVPRLRGIVASLVGPGPIYDHHAVHVVKAGHRWGQSWHADSTIDPRRHFDVQLMYFPQETTAEMGGTLLLPGSHFRMVHEMEVARYQNFRGQLRVVCPAGTVFAVHHNLWHCGQPNRTPTTRYMFKLRLNPTFKQKRLWDTSDLEAPEIGRLLVQPEPWMGTDVRLEFIQRIKLWRLLTGNDGFDVMHWLGRLENQPGRELPERE
jgi:hypothetical protein